MTTTRPDFLRMARDLGPVVVRDHRGQHETIPLAPGTVELRLPWALSFTALGAVPDHVHHYSEMQVAVFVPRDQCRRCQPR